MRVPLERKVLNENDKIAAGLRERYKNGNVFCVNMISSPGSGKTSLLERTLEGYDPSRRIAVLTGDIQTDNDARRLARFGFPVRQICTGGACHLDASMVLRNLAGWDVEALETLFVENVGNLVCPTSYYLGEDVRAVVLSVTEGEDKPLKYPATFHHADLMVLNKIDLLPYVPFQAELAIENARRVQPTIDILQVSCTTGQGLDEWMKWLDGQRALAAAK